MVRTMAVVKNHTQTQIHPALQQKTALSLGRQRQPDHPEGQQI